MEHTSSELLEAKRQIDSVLHKLRETVKTLQGREHPERLRSQITLAQRRIAAFELSRELIERELARQSDPPGGA